MLVKCNGVIEDIKPERVNKISINKTSNKNTTQRTATTQKLETNPLTKPNKKHKTQSLNSPIFLTRPHPFFSPPTPTPTPTHLFIFIFFMLPQLPQLSPFTAITVENPYLGLSDHVIVKYEFKRYYIS